MNPEGKGDEISNHVKFAPWLGEPVQSPPELISLVPAPAPAISG